MSNNNLAIFKGYQYWVDVQWYEVIEEDKTRNKVTDNEQ